MNRGHDPGAEPAACIPLDVLATWLAPDALARIERFFGPERRAAQVDTEWPRSGLWRCGSTEWRGWCWLRLGWRIRSKAPPKARLETSVRPHMPPDRSHLCLRLPSGRLRTSVYFARRPTLLVRVRRGQFLKAERLPAIALDKFTKINEVPARRRVLSIMVL